MIRRRILIILAAASVLTLISWASSYRAEVVHSGGGCTYSEEAVGNNITVSVLGLDVGYTANRGSLNFWLGWLTGWDDASWGNISTPFISGWLFNMQGYLSSRLATRHWLMFAILFAYPASAFIRGPLCRGLRRRRGTCANCRYDLTGNLSGRCPECGLDVKGAYQIPAVERPERGWTTLRLCKRAAAIVGLGLCMLWLASWWIGVSWAGPRLFWGIGAGRAGVVVIPEELRRNEAIEIRIDELFEHRWWGWWDYVLQWAGTWRFDVSLAALIWPTFAFALFLWMLERRSARCAYDLIRHTSGRCSDCRSEISSSESHAQQAST